MNSSPHTPTQARHQRWTHVAAIAFVSVAVIGGIVFAALQLIKGSDLPPTDVVAWSLFLVACGIGVNHLVDMITDEREDPELRTAYRERARILAYLASQHPSVLAANDPDYSDMWVLYVDTPHGQLSWHIDVADTRLFDHVERVADDDPRAEWDGHADHEKHMRLDALIAGAAGTSTDPQ